MSELNLSEMKKINFDNKVKFEQLSIETFLELSEVPMQRDTEGRAVKQPTIKMLKKLLAVHLEVAIVELTKDCTYFGILYKKGCRFIVNGNTRAYFWLNKLTDNIPEKVNATVYYVENMEEIRAIYNTYDSPTAVENTQAKFYGILSGVYGYQPTSSKLKKGTILTGLYCACNLKDSQAFLDGKPKEEVLPILIREYFEELKMFDKICTVYGNFDSALSCAALMILKKYKDRPRELPKAIEFLERVGKRHTDTTQAERDGVTHVSVEWTIDPKKAMFKNRRAATGGMGGMQETVPFVLYWAEKYIAGKKQSKLGNGWDKIHLTWFDEYNAMNNSLAKALSIDKIMELEDLVA